jgi:2-iminobutanoate/2-iminopropanoate deaminase
MKTLCLSLVLLGSSSLFASNAKAQQTVPAQAKPSQPAQSVEYLGASRTAPLSEAVRVGHMLYLSGQLGVGSGGTLVTGGIKAETKQVLENIRAILEKNGSGMDQVVKCTVMLADIADRSSMNEVYTTFFSKERLPARSTFGTTGLALSARVEIECMATIK